MSIATKKSKARVKRRPGGVAIPVIIVPINTFAPEPYDIIRQTLAVVQPSAKGFIASLYDANIHASGDTEEEAFRNLKSLTLDLLDSLSAESPGTLGPEPRRQLAVLQQFIQKKR